MRETVRETARETVRETGREEGMRETVRERVDTVVWLLHTRAVACGCMRLHPVR